MNGMKTFSILILTTILLSGCNHPDNVVFEQGSPTEIENTGEPTPQPSPLNNPAIIYGSDLGSIIRKAYQIGDYELMLQFTANETIKTFGRDSLLNCYKNLDMGKEITLKSISKEDNLLIMNYEAIDQATKVMVRLPVIIENDTAKIKPEYPCNGSLYK